MTASPPTQFRDLLLRNPWEKVREVMEYRFPDRFSPATLKKYGEVYERLKRLEGRGASVRLQLIELQNDPGLTDGIEEPPYPWIDDRIPDSPELPPALEFVDWREWIEMEVDTDWPDLDSLKFDPELEFLAASMWMLTYCGTNPESGPEKVAAMSEQLDKTDSSEDWVEIPFDPSDSQEEFERKFLEAMGEDDD